MSTAVKTKPVATSSNHFVAHFVLEKETKGALRYMQVTAPGNTTAFSIGEGAEIGTLYIRKSAFKDGNPKTLIITVS